MRAKDLEQETAQQNRLNDQKNLTLLLLYLKFYSASS